MMKEWIRSNRRRLEQELRDSPRRPLFSPAYYSQYQVTLPLIRRFARGKLIDLGCGDMPFRNLIADKISSYESLDFYPRTPDVTHVGDIQDMSMIDAESYDTAICLEVLEHVPDPFQAVREIRRILKPDGILIVSVPHLSRLHDEPHDYYRFTRHGIKYLLEHCGFTVLFLARRGGLFSFLGHQIATLSLCLVWRIPVLKDIVWFLNSWLTTRAAYGIDRILDTSGIFAMGYSAAASKRPDRASPSDRSIVHGQRIG